MPCSKDTHLTGKYEGFPTTQWPLFQDYRDLEGQHSQAIINSLAQRYWRPVYTWLLRKGYSIEKAQDLTQGFFCDIVLERDLIRRADRSRGRFRTFLLTALKGFISDEYRKEHALKRRPEGELFSFEADDVLLPDGPVISSPDAAFDFMWASNILDHVIDQLEQEYQVKGMEIHWKVFSARVLRPILHDCEEMSYDSLCEELGIPDTHKAAAMTTSVKRRFRTLLRQVVRRHVAADSEIDNEISELLAIFSEKDA